jgi:hypothetical protein
VAPPLFAALVTVTSWQAGFAFLAVLPLLGVWTLGPLARDEVPAPVRETAPGYYT